MSFMAGADFRKMMKLMIYVAVFLGLLFPGVKEIGDFKINLETYAIVLAGIEVFEMTLKYIVEKRIKNKKHVSKRVERLYDSMQ